MPNIQLLETHYYIKIEQLKFEESDMRRLILALEDIMRL